MVESINPDVTDQSLPPSPFRAYFQSSIIQNNAGANGLASIQVKLNTLVPHSWQRLIAPAPDRLHGKSNLLPSRSLTTSVGSQSIP